MGYTELDTSHHSGTNQATGDILAVEKSPVYLAQLGFKTQRDGTYILDQKALDSTFAGEPDRFNALVKDHAYSVNPDVSVIWSPKMPWDSDGGAVPGIYQIYHEHLGGGHALYTRGERQNHATHVNKTGPVNGVYSFIGHNNNPDKLEGLTITTTKTDLGDDTNMDVYLGRSFATLFSTFHDDLLNNYVDHRRQEQNYATKLESLEDRLVAIELRSNSLAQSYNTKFQAMEQNVTSFNSTGNYLDSFISQWNDS